MVLAPPGEPANGTGEGHARCWVAIGRFMVMVLESHNNNCGDTSQSASSHSTRHYTFV